MRQRIFNSVFLVFAFCFHFAGAASGQAGQTSSTVPPRLSEEKAFLYYVSIYGAPNNYVERYGKFFEPDAYARAMANEFERRSYEDRIRQRIEAGIRSLDFSDKFTAVGWTTSQGFTSLGEYSFSSNSFPLLYIPDQSICRNIDRSAGICGGTFLDVRNARVQDAVNGAEFAWSVPMSLQDAEAFVKGRTDLQSGAVNRRVAVRTTYSIVNKREVAGRGAILFPYVHSVEVFSDESLAKRLGVIVPKPGTPLSAFLTEAIQEALSATKTIETFKYTASCRESYRCVTPIVGEITLTDAGIVLSGEQRDGSSKPSFHNFYDAVAKGATSMYRANYTNATWGGSDFRVVWRPFWQFDHETLLVFAAQQERDRFFVALAQAIQDWGLRYPQFSGSGEKIQVLCAESGKLVKCPAGGTPEAATMVPPASSAAAPAAATAAAGIVAPTTSRGSETTSSRPTTNRLDGRGLDELVKEVEGGGEVSVAVSYNSVTPDGPRDRGIYSMYPANAVYMASGVLTIRRDKIAFKGSAGLVDFDVSPDKILALTNQPTQASRIYLQVSVPNKKSGKDEKKVIYLYHASARGQGNGRVGGPGASITCTGCDNTMTILSSLLERLRGPR